MSTRALYTFTDETSSWNVYKHHNGYPTGAASVINAALKWFAWPLPRFEADEFAAAFCAAGKAHRMLDLVEREIDLETFLSEDAAYGDISHGGGVRFMPQGDPRMVAVARCCDIEYRYEVTVRVKVKDLYITAYEVSAWDEYSEKKIFSGPLKKFTAWAKEEENKAA